MGKIQFVDSGYISFLCNVLFYFTSFPFHNTPDPSHRGQVGRKKHFDLESCNYEFSGTNLVDRNSLPQFIGTIC